MRAIPAVQEYPESGDQAAVERYLRQHQPVMLPEDGIYLRAVRTVSAINAFIAIGRRLHEDAKAVPPGAWVKEVGGRELGDDNAGRVMAEYLRTLSAALQTDSSTAGPGGAKRRGAALTGTVTVLLAIAAGVQDPFSNEDAFQAARRAWDYRLKKSARRRRSRRVA